MYIYNNLDLLYVYFSGFPLLNIADIVSLIINLNQPLLAFENSKRQLLFQAYKQSLPQQKKKSFQWYA